MNPAGTSMTQVVFKAAERLDGRPVLDGTGDRPAGRGFGRGLPVVSRLKADGGEDMIWG